MPLLLAPTFRERIAQSARPLAGMWVCSGSPLVAEICAGAGLDWLLIDTEHSPNGLESTLAQLQAVAAYPVTPVVRAPVGDVVMVKQLLDLGAQNLLIPMVSSAEQAEEMVSAVRYPPRGVRGVGSALARAARWNRVEDYLGAADAHVSLYVQIETAAGVEAAGEISAVDGIDGVFVGPSDLAASMGLLGQQTHPDVEAAGEIAAVDGIDGVFVGPSDLAASMGLLGQQTHPDVEAAVMRAFKAVQAAGTPVGVNAFDPELADRYLGAGASFILVGADVSLLARGSEGLAARFATADSGDREDSLDERESY